jgi:hypothetical protein
MGFEMRGIDHQPLGRFLFASQFHKDAFEYAHLAPAHETVIQRLVRPVLLGGILPLQAILYHVINPAEYPLIVNVRNYMGQGEIKLYTVNCVFDR